MFDWLQKESIARGDTGLAIEAAHNTHVAFSNLGRHGAARSALRPFVEDLAKKPFPSDPLAYPDRGAAFDFLPDVRKRDFSRMNTASNSFVFTMHRLAEDDFHAGDWPRGLERLLWADDWRRRMGELQHEPDESWLQLRQGIAFMFYRLGLYEAADGQYAAVLGSGFEDGIEILEKEINRIDSDTDDVETFEAIFIEKIRMLTLAYYNTALESFKLSLFDMCSRSLEKASLCLKNFLVNDLSFERIKNE